MMEDPDHPDFAPPTTHALQGLNERQEEAARTQDGPLLVLAGAGSGKTKMLTARIAHLIETKKARPFEILAVTFTNKAAHEMKERVQRILTRIPGGGFSSPEIGTFHSVFIRLLRREMDKLPFTAPFVVYDDSDQLSLIKNLFKKHAIDDKEFSPTGFQWRINRLKCDAVDPSEFEPSPHSRVDRKFAPFYGDYQKALFAHNALDFGEILTMAHRLLRDHEDVRKRYQARWRYVHVDEYQDTNRVQYQLLQLLCARPHGGSGNVCVVGDEDQSIYKWRGADIRNILDFEHDFPDSRVVKLERNYRSSGNIVAAASHLIQHNLQRKHKTLWTEADAGVPLMRFQLPDDRTEADLVVSEIRKLAREEGRSLNEFAVLYRTHAQSRVLEDALRRERFPYQIIGGLRFYDRKEVKDLISYLKLILNPADAVSLRRVLNVPARGIGKTTIDKLNEAYFESPEGTTFWDVLSGTTRGGGGFSAGTQKKLTGFVQMVEKWRADASQILLSELYHRILDDTRYVAALKEDGSVEALSRIENLEEFDRVLAEFEEEFLGEAEDNPEDAKKRLLVGFLEQAALVNEEESPGAVEGEAPEGVKLMTLHGCKGLEFPVVFMVGMEEGLFPSKHGDDEGEAELEGLEEERRLCYVGMTRARERLYLMHAVVRRIWGQISFQRPARFFDEIPSKLVSFSDLSRYMRSQEGRY